MSPTLALALLMLTTAPGLAPPQARIQPRTKAAPPAAERSVPIVPVRLVGRWTDSGDCSRYVIFRSDGTFLRAGGGQGSWRLERERLTLSGPGGSVALTISALTATRMTVVNPDGSAGMSRRC